MNAENWDAFYHGGWQWPWALLVVPFAWAIARAIARGDAPDSALGRFVRLWGTVFVLETMLDPVAGACVRGASAAVQTGTGLFFVLAGDFRIYWLLAGIADGGRITARGFARAAAMTAAVPSAAFALTRAAAAIQGELSEQVLWLTHEALFVAVVAFAARIWVPAVLSGETARYARWVCAWVAAYYALWAAADVLILAGVDAGWAVRCVPNQLYYALTVPVLELGYGWVVNARSSTSTQASR